MLLFLGDVHGKFVELSEKIARTKVSDSSIIQIGDFGVGFRKQQEHEELQSLNSILSVANNCLYIIRGNHDDPAFFTGKSAFSNILFLRDYTLLKLEGLNILLVGGAVSVDRSLRTPGVDYWNDEIFNYNQELLSNTLSNVESLDVVVTHNAPTEFWPYQVDNLVLKFSRQDECLLRDLQNERNSHSQLIRQLQKLQLLPKTWYYGHFHASYSSVYLQIQYTMLNCLELIEHKS